jgi:predicted N-acetyltransferase YhbS
MEYKALSYENINEIIPLYIDYYNGNEGGEWTEATVRKRIRQVLSRDDSFGLVLEDNCNLIAFAMGYFEQFDDGTTYNLVEIVVSQEYQNRGIGSKLMLELEKQVKEMGAMLISLQAVNDDSHDRFYGRLGYGNCKNFVIKIKMLDS